MDVEEGNLVSFYEICNTKLHDWFIKPKLYILTCNLRINSTMILKFYSFDETHNFDAILKV